MIHPDQFYSADDYPADRQRASMWARIRREMGGPSRFLFLADRRSFFHGMAASFLVMFAAVGVYTTARGAIEYSQPQAVKLDRAYQSAIREFERIAIQTMDGSQSELSKELSLTRKEHLELLDKAINELKLETNSNDFSSLKRVRLRQLYSLKLKLLQEMVEQGEIEL
ncbi:MAG: hypothetical protein HY562_07800 [Ignavibacteriales bacterium]|nr:hypothetical protein [Ignavibacteriales bacterium]